jgi:hypothetical protein
LLVGFELKTQTLQIAPIINLGIASSFDFDPSIRKIGISESIGTQLNLDFTSSFALNASIQVEIRNFRHTVNLMQGRGFVVGQAVTRQNLLFWSLPLAARMKFGKDDLFFVDIGGVGSYLGYEQLEPKVKFNNQLTVVPFSASVNNYELAALFGFGVNVPISETSSIQIGIRNTIGLSDRASITSSARRTENTHCLQLAFYFGKK